jgi:hypothetical protein
MPTLTAEGPLQEAASEAAEAMLEEPLQEAASEAAEAMLEAASSSEDEVEVEVEVGPTVTAASSSEDEVQVGPTVTAADREESARASAVELGSGEAAANPIVIEAAAGGRGSQRLTHAEMSTTAIGDDYVQKYASYLPPQAALTKANDAMVTSYMKVDFSESVAVREWLASGDVATAWFEKLDKSGSPLQRLPWPYDICPGPLGAFKRP